MSGNKPAFRLQVKGKESGAKLYLAAFWRNERGIGGTLDKSIAKIVLKDGKVITPSGCYFNLYYDDEQLGIDWHGQEEPTDDQQQTQAPPKDDEVPF